MKAQSPYLLKTMIDTLLKSMYKSTARWSRKGAAVELPDVLLEVEFGALFSRKAANI